MAHLIDMSNGKANMAFTGSRSKIWHSLGQEMATNAPVEDWVKAAGLDWTAVNTPIYFSMGGEMHQAADRFAIVRSDTKRMLGAFTGRYKEVQPAEIVEFFQNYILADSRFSLSTMGALKGGAVIWALAKFSDDSDVIGEKHERYVLLTTSFDGSRATTAQATMVRVVCWNTLTASIFDPSAATVSIRHSSHFTREAQAGAVRQLAKIAGTFDGYKALAESLATARMTADQTNEFFTRLIMAETSEEKASTRMKNMLANMLESYEATLAEGTEKGTAWAAFNAVTRYVDHGRATRRTNGDSEETARFASSLIGSGAAMKAQAAKLLAAADYASGGVTVPAGMAALAA